MPGLASVGALIAAVTILQMAQGLLGAHMPLAFAAQGHAGSLFSFVAAAYSAGFMFGAAIATRLLARVGHIRVFAACASVLSVSTLALYVADSVTVWMVTRAAAGVAVALMFGAAESWMSASIQKSERGNILGFYMVCTKAALAIGPLLVVSAAPGDAAPWMIAAALASIAMIPVCATTVAQPEPPKPQPLAVAEQFRTAPAAVIACFGAGAVNAGVLAFAPLFAAERYGAGAASAFYSAAWLGSLLLQWPAGRLSDRVDRRMVIAGLTGLAAVSAFALAAFAGAAPAWAGMALFALWGAGGLSFYGIAVAHMADRAPPAVMAQATSGLLFVWALGSVIGPAAQWPFVHFFGSGGVFWFAGLCAAAIAGAMFWRGTQREPASPEVKENFAAPQTTSVVAAEIAYGKPDAR